MTLKRIIPEAEFEGLVTSEEVRALYTLENGTYVLTGVEGIAPLEDLNKVKGALEKERNDHRKLKTSIQPLGTIDEIRTKLDRVDELEALATGKVDDEKINGIVEGRIKLRVAPLQRQIEELTTGNTALESELANLRQADVTRTLNETIARAAKKANLRDTAVEDAMTLAERHFTRNEDGEFVVKDGVAGMTPGVSPDVWLTQVKQSRPHWWGESSGGGAGGSGNTGGGGAENPWSLAHWNLTKQGQIVVSDAKRAEQLARAAGTTVGGPKPAKKA